MGRAHRDRQQGRGKQTHRNGWVCYECLRRLRREQQARRIGQPAHDGRRRQQYAHPCKGCDESVCCGACRHGQRLWCARQDEGGQCDEQQGGLLGGACRGQSLWRRAYGDGCDGRGDRQHDHHHGRGDGRRRCLRRLYDGHGGDDGQHGEPRRRHGGGEAHHARRGGDGGGHDLRRQRHGDDGQRPQCQRQCHGRQHQELCRSEFPLCECDDEYGEPHAEDHGRYGNRAGLEYLRLYGRHPVGREAHAHAERREYQRGELHGGAGDHEHEHDERSRHRYAEPHGDLDSDRRQRLYLPRGG